LLAGIDGGVKERPAFGPRLDQTLVGHDPQQRLDGGECTLLLLAHRAMYVANLSFAQLPKNLQDIELALTRAYV
jgi:hypothetical protein